MKKLVIKTIAYFLTIGAAVFIPAFVIDPYNVFHAGKPRDNGIESNKSFIKTEYIRKHHDEFDSLLFGSSRAGFVDIGYLNEMTGASFYDMASSESLVGEQVTELKAIIKSGFVPERVWVLIDDISCFVDPELHEDMLYRVPYPEGPFEKAEFYLKYTDIFTNIESIKIINETKAKKALEALEGIDTSYDDSTNMSYLDRLYHTGTERLDKPSPFDPNDENNQRGFWSDYYSLRTEAAVKEMQEMADLCEKYGIELTVLTNPLYCLTYEKAAENGYLEYLRALADVTDYYNFSSLNDITNDYTNYYETSHFMPKVTRKMIDCICVDTKNSNTKMQNDEYLKLAEQGFGVKVTKDNADDIINYLKGQTEY